MGCIGLCGGRGEAEPVWDFVRDIWVYLEPVEHRDVVVDNALSDQRRMAVTRVFS